MEKDMAGDRHLYTFGSGWTALVCIDNNNNNNNNNNKAIIEYRKGKIFLELPVGKT